MGDKKIALPCFVSIASEYFENEEPESTRTSAPNPANVTISDDLTGNAVRLVTAELQSLVDGLGYLYERLQDRLTAIHMVDPKLPPVSDEVKAAVHAEYDRCVRLHALFSDLLERST